MRGVNKYFLYPVSTSGVNSGFYRIMFIDLDKHIGPGTVAAFRMGDEKAFEAIYHLCFSVLCLYAENFIRDEEEARDIVQGTFEKLWKRRAGFEDARRIAGFLCLTVTNKCIDHKKEVNRRARHYNNIALASNIENDVLRAMFPVDMIQRVRDEIERLPVQCRKVMRMSYVEGKKIDEIAAALHLSANTVRNQRARGRELLKHRLKNLFFEIGALVATILSIKP